MVRLTQRVGISTLILHHASRGSGEYRGSTAIGAAVELGFTLARIDGDPMAGTRRRLTCWKSRPAPEPAERWLTIKKGDAGEILLFEAAPYEPQRGSASARWGRGGVAGPCGGVPGARGVQRGGWHLGINTWGFGGATPRVRLRGLAPWNPRCGRPPRWPARSAAIRRTGPCDEQFRGLVEAQLLCRNGDGHWYSKRRPRSGQRGAGPMSDPRDHQRQARRRVPRWLLRGGRRGRRRRARAARRRQARPPACARRGGRRAQVV